MRHAGMAFVSGLSPVLDFGLSTDLRSSASFFDFTRRLTGTLRASLFTNTSIERRDLNPHIRLFKADAHTHAFRSKDERIFSAQWSRRESNPRPSACRADALPVELRPRGKRTTGLEPARPPRQGGALPITPRPREVKEVPGFLTSMCFSRPISRQWDGVVSNHHPPVFQTGAQTAYATVPCLSASRRTRFRVVGMTGLEPATSRSRTARSSKLNHIPMCAVSPKARPDSARA